jgi:nitroimidazol reductase NimA-like FMN-containing flavoprotein (pyridoxamine 5'-phosphate oxidase superfamily)
VSVQRHSERGVYDRDAIDEILDEGFVAHLGIVSDQQPFVLPVLYARDGDSIYVHGSPLSRLLGAAAAGVPVCLTVTLLDGLVLARSAFKHSVNYRSVVVLGDGYEIEDPDHKREALRKIVDQVLRGRSEDVRGPSKGELKATEVVAIAVREVSAKVRTGPPLDSARDRKITAWAGEVPLQVTPGEPIPDSYCSAELPAYLRDYSR